MKGKMEMERWTRGKKDEYLTQETAHLTRTILDSESSTVGNVSRALGGVVLAVQVTGNLQEVALGTWDPQVA
jgi:hypothetical protein